jgi:hypothetical protein
MLTEWIARFARETPDDVHKSRTAVAMFAGHLMPVASSRPAVCFATLSNSLLWL